MNTLHLLFTVIGWILAIVLAIELRDSSNQADADTAEAIKQAARMRELEAEIARLKGFQTRTLSAAELRACSDATNHDAARRYGPLCEGRR